MIKKGEKTVQGVKTDKETYDKVKSYIRRKYAQRDIQKLEHVSTDIIKAIRHSDNYDDFCRKQYGEPTGEKTADMYKFSQIIGTLREQAKQLTEIKELLEELTKALK